MKFDNLPENYKHLKDIDDNNIEQLQSVSNSIVHKIKKKSNELKELKKEVDLLNTINSKINNQINVLKSIPKETKITDHALIRFMERSMGINVKDIIGNEILTPNVISMVKNIGFNGDIELKNNLIAVVRNNTIVSVTPKK